MTIGINTSALGPLVRIGPYSVASTNPDDARKIYQIKSEFKKASWYDIPKEVNVFSTQNVDQHRRYRKALSHPLSESGLKDVLPQVEDKVRLAIQRISEEMESRGVADVFKWWMSLTSDVIGQLTFGESFRILDKGEVGSHLHKAPNRMLD
jgi:cytochrome P450